MKKKFYSLIAICAGCFLSLNVAAQTGSWSDNATEVTPVDNVYSITTAAELAWIGNQVTTGDETFEGKIIRLVADIDLGAHFWDPMGGLDANYTLKPFKGTFEGKNGSVYHKIKNLYINAGTAANPGTWNSANCTVGFIRFIDTGAVMRNVIFESGNVTGVDGRLGVAAGCVRGLIENVANIGVSVTAGGTTAQSAGGGITYMIDRGGIIQNCYNTASVTGGRYAGGIVGSFEGGGDDIGSYVIGCFNRGAIALEGDNTRSRSAGGIVGQVVTSKTGSVNFISGCYNAGTVSLTGTSTHATNDASAILGYSSVSGNNSTIEIISCFGDLTLTPDLNIIKRISNTKTTVTGGGMAATEVVKNATTLAELNAASGDAFGADTESINGGYPVLKFMTGSSTSVGKTLAEDNLTFSVTRGKLRISVKQPVHVVVYSVTGRLVGSQFVESEAVFQFERGIYIVNGKKVIL